MSRCLIGRGMEVTNERDLPKSTYTADVHLYGRIFRLYPETSDVFILSHVNDYEWYKLKPNLSRPERGWCVGFARRMDRYNQKVVRSTQKQISLSELFALGFISPGADLHREGYFVRHKDGNTLNHSVDNLEWVKKERHFKETIKQTIPVGTHFGWVVVLENIDRLETNPKYPDKTFLRTLIRCKCRCGNEVVFDPSKVRRGDMLACCGNCKKMIGVKTATRMMIDDGLRYRSGKLNNGRPLWSYRFQYPDQQ